MSLDFLVPRPRRIRLFKAVFPRPRRMRVAAAGRVRATAEALKKDLRGLAGVSVSDRASFRIALRIRPRAARAEGYRLRLDRRGAELIASDRAGLYYGTQTLLQILVLGEPGALPTVRISDWPEFGTRSFMIDMGRSIFRMPLLERIVRILARLKMNTLHLHLNDDQLCGLRFRRLPLGRENPGAITLAQLGRLVEYARRHHVTVLPEFECWGHAQSVIYHYPQLYGGPGMWGGMSFGIGEETFALFQRVFDELLPVLEKDCQVHVGLDEAQWALLPGVPGADRAKYSPKLLVGRLYDILRRAGGRSGRNVTMHLWADHGGRPLPREIAGKVVIQPWNYFRHHEPIIRKKMRRYAGRGKTPLMMGGGMSSVCFGGDFGATRLWCQAGAGKPNVRGVTVCFWEDNDLPEKMIGLYAGADYAWSPESPAPRKGDPFDERLRADVGRNMRVWQARFRDGDDEAIRRDRGPQVYRGHYCWGKLAGRPVAPTVEMARPDDGAAFG
jgi:hypothetical protein